MSNLNRLSEILYWKMTEGEARAFKLSLTWEDFTKKMFPNISCGKLPKKGDPRKSLLFRYCYKLIRETKGVILDDQYEWYIKAQLDILKNIGVDYHPNISPACLVGEKAWKRWKVWLNKFQAMSRVERAEIIISESKVISKLKKTKEFLVKQFKKEPTFADIEQALKSRAFIRWLTLGKITGYYVLLSPFVFKCLDGKNFEQEFNFDLSVYENSITDFIKKYFNEEFKYEFN